MGPCIGKTNDTPISYVDFSELLHRRALVLDPVHIFGVFGRFSNTVEPDCFFV